MLKKGMEVPLGASQVMPLSSNFSGADSSQDYLLCIWILMAHLSNKHQSYTNANYLYYTNL